MASQSYPSLALLRPHRAAAVLTCVALFMVVMHLVALGLKGRLPLETAELFMARFDLEEELTAPAWFASMMLLVCGGLLVWLSRVLRDRGGPDAGRWFALGLLFVVLSVDEAASFHELLGPLVRNNLNVGGLFYYAWVIPGLVLCAVLTAIYLPAVWRWPARTRWLSLVAAVLYVGGALGLEMIGGAIAQEHGRYNTAYRVAVVVEESLEMAGLILFIYTLLDYLQTVAARLDVPDDPALQ